MENLVWSRSRVPVDVAGVQIHKFVRGGKLVSLLPLSVVLKVGFVVVGSEFLVNGLLSGSVLRATMVEADLRML